MKSNISNWLTRLIGFLNGAPGSTSNRESELAEAKKMFLDYGCNHFYMMKEGESKKYEQYQVSKEQEKIWHDEYIAYWLERLSVDDLTALRHLRNSWTQDVIPALMDAAVKGDSYAKFWFAYILLDLSRNQWHVHKQGREAAIALFKSLVKGPVVISKQHQTEISPSMMAALGASSPEEYLINYSKQKLTELKVKLSSL